MAIIPLFRRVIFTLITLLSFAVLGICAHIEYLTAGYTNVYLSFVPLGLAASCLTIVSLPLFLVLGNSGQRIFTSTIVFEIIWFFVLWLVWVGTAADTIAGKSFIFPGGCIYSDYATANEICDEFTMIEAFAFLNFFCAFIYYDVIFMYAIISAIRGRSVWVASVKEAANAIPGTVKLGMGIVQPQLDAASCIPPQPYGAYPSSHPLQPLNAYPQQISTPVSPAPPYTAYPHAIPPQSSVPHQYGAYPQQAPSQGPPMMQPGPNQTYNYQPATPQDLPITQPPQGYSYVHHSTPVASQQPAHFSGYVLSPPANDGALSPQPNYTTHPAHGLQGYQGQSAPGRPSPPLPSPYGAHPIPTAM